MSPPETIYLRLSDTTVLLRSLRERGQMLIYCNNLKVRGPASSEVVFRAVGGWLKEQLGYGLRPDQLRVSSEYTGQIAGGVSRVIVRAATEDENVQMFSWTLKSVFDENRGRQWVTELGVRHTPGLTEVSCLTRTEEVSALVTTSAAASRPRVIGYIANNVSEEPNAEFDALVAGTRVKTVGQDEDSYRGLMMEIEHPARDAVVIVVSPNAEGNYPVDCERLQSMLIGIGQIVRVDTSYHRYQMRKHLGQRWSAWDGAINILHLPNRSGFVRARYFLPEEIATWGETAHDKNIHLLAWVTNNTNLIRHRSHITPHGVAQLALRQELRRTVNRLEDLDAGELRREIARFSELERSQREWAELLQEDNDKISSDLADARAKIEILEEEAGKTRFEISGLKAQLGQQKGGGSNSTAYLGLLKLARRSDDPSPVECLETIANAFPSQCVILESAWKSAEAMDRFIEGRQLLDMLCSLMTDYRITLMEKGDAEARKIFGRKEFAAKESETVMNSKALSRQRTFEYPAGSGKQIEMFRHLKIGADDDVGRTIRVHLHWDGDAEKIVIGYCGEHLAISGK